VRRVAGLLSYITGWLCGLSSGVRTRLCCLPSALAWRRWISSRSSSGKQANWRIGGTLLLGLYLDLFFLAVRSSCAHYRRGCRIVAPCCGDLFGCRHCHNDAKVRFSHPSIPSFLRRFGMHKATLKFSFPLFRRTRYRSMCVIGMRSLATR
jgi:hypothetical protein